MSGKKFGKNRIISYAGLTVACLAVLTLIVFGAVNLIKKSQEEATLDRFRETMNTDESGPLANVSRGPDSFEILKPTPEGEQQQADPAQTTETKGSPTPSASPTPRPIVMMEDMAELYAYNSDVIGYLYIPDTKINYPVMQTFDDPSTPDEDESQYYIKRGIEKQYLKRGSLFMDHRSVAGEGYLQDNYFGGIGPSNIIMIYGHNMADGEMFGYLYYYMNTDYAMEHRYIEFDTLFERRRYEVVSAFRSHVFTVEDYMDYSKYNDPNFKYYQFCGDLTEDRFVYWYSNVMSHNENDLSEYNASYDDEFLVLSTCSGTDETGAKNEDGRLCVVAVRIE